MKQKKRLMYMALDTNFTFKQACKEILHPWTYKEFMDLDEYAKELVLNAYENER